MTILTDADYPAIRAALDMALDANSLPDSLIAHSIYLGAAEAEVIRRDPDAASRTGDELIHVKNAIILITAALLAPIMPPVEVSSVNAARGRQEDETDAIVARLRSRADAEINAVLYPDTAVYPTLFAVGEGTRGK